jgi:hypothetical protein
VEENSTGQDIKFNEIEWIFPAFRDAHCGKGVGEVTPSL